MENFSEYVESEFKKWFTRDIKSRCQDYIDSTVGLTEDFYNVLVTLRVIKDKVENLSEIMDPEMEELGLRMEEKMGCTFDDLIDDNNKVLMIKNMFKIVIPYVWKSRFRFYYIYLMSKRLGLVMMIQGAMKMVNPLVWYRFWRGYYEQRNEISTD